MIKKIDNKAFTLIEVLVVVAIIGILALLALPRFIGQTQKAELVRIQHDVKAMEKEIGAKLINGDDSFNEWESNSKDLNQLVQDKELFEKEGIAEELDSTEGTYKIVPKEYKAKINTKLKGTFYANSGGKVYYEHGEGPGYSDEEIADLIKEGYIPIATAEELNNVRSATLETYGKGTEWEGKYTGGLNKKYVQVANIDLSGYSEGEGWNPIGTDFASNFTGTYDGNGHNITGLTINRPQTDYVGLFGYTEKATISNVSLEDVNVTGKSYVGGLVGDTYSGTIENSYATGSVTGKTTEWGSSYTGGLVGYAHSSTISNSFATGEVKGAGNQVGGLVGTANSPDGTSVISNSFATGSVKSEGYHVGGLVGDTYSGTIENSYATGEVTGSGGYVGGLAGDARYITISNSYATGSVESLGRYVGGLVGDAYSDVTISNSYATGSVNGNNHVGGLAGRSDDSNISNSSATGEVTGTSHRVGGFVGFAYSGTISNSYAKGSVSGAEKVGGFVGEAYNGIKINNSYATGLVEGGSYTGGLVGKATENGWTGDYTVAVRNSYWDKDTTGQTTSAKQNASFGKTTEEMKKQITYTDWDFDTIWKIDEGKDYPKLR